MVPTIRICMLTRKFRIMKALIALFLLGVSNGVTQNITTSYPRRLWAEDEANSGILSVKMPLSPLTSGSSMPELVLSQGYPLEEYEVVTEDGYILTVFRIPYGKNQTSSPKTPLLLQHGLFSTSASWVISEPYKGLGFVLADAGFDVWLSNSRGTTYSRKHIKYNPNVDKKEFFNYSFHEMGYYDLPAVIDFMLNKSDTSQIIYVGHSQGTTEFYVMASTRPEYNAKVKVSATMAPIAHFTHCKGTVKILSDFTGVLGVAAKVLGLYEVLSNSPLIHLVDTTLCRKSSAIEALCSNFLFALTGFDAKQFNESLIPMIVDQGPSGASVKQLTHFGQLANNGGKFSMYDYGSTGNREHYGQDTAPEYDLTKITVATNLHYSLNDWLADVEDVKKLHSRLTKSKLIEVPYPAFNHLDFLWAKDVRPLLYNNMISMLKESVGQAGI
uniref:Gastric triacylglycerol lipase n=1 Tax=Lygus hesperus TaxID=30085 RepID=A0A146LJT0_LYGHE